MAALVLRFLMSLLGPTCCSWRSLIWLTSATWTRRSFTSFWSNNKSVDVLHTVFLRAACMHFYAADSVVSNARYVLGRLLVKPSDCTGAHLLCGTCSNPAYLLRTSDSVFCFRRKVFVISVGVKVCALLLSAIRSSAVLCEHIKPLLDVSRHPHRGSWRLRLLSVSPAAAGFKHTHTHLPTLKTPCLFHSCHLSVLPFLYFVAVK